MKIGKYISNNAQILAQYLLMIKGVMDDDGGTHGYIKLKNGYFIGVEKSFEDGTDYLNMYLTDSIDDMLYANGKIYDTCSLTEITYSTDEVLDCLEYLCEYFERNGD